MLNSKKDLRAILAILLIVVILFSWLFKPASSTNEIVTNQSDQADIALKIYAPSPDSKLTLDGIVRIRREALESTPQLSITNYTPVAGLFTQVKDDLPWISEQDSYVLGDKARKFQGVAAEGLSIANPLLLLRPEFIDLSIHGKLQWNQEIIIDQNPSFPIRPLLSSLVWQPSKSSATAVYLLSHFISQIRGLTTNPITVENSVFSVVSYNAVDFGFNFIQLALNKSSNIQNPNQSNVAQLGFSAVGYSDKLCGENVCNGLLLSPPSLNNIIIEKLPAQAVFHLWKKWPESASVQPDFEFSLEFE